MAEIFLARREGPEGFSRELVVKRILPHLGADPDFVAMFLDEARIAARLTHPHTVQVYDFGEVDGQYYLAMELVRGVDLAALIQRAAELARAEGRLGAVPPQHAAKLLSFVCEGLAHAHGLSDDQGRPLRLVHRDVTPSNVLLSFDGAVKVADFGIAKADRRSGVSSAERTRSGVVKGKRSYLSPEQSRGEPLDHRSDLFNVGILLYEACTGVPLFPCDGYRAAMEEVRRGRLPGEQWLEGTPPALVATLRRALAPRPELRHPDALALRAELEAFLRSWPEPSDAVELGAYVRGLFPDLVQRDRFEARAAGTVPALTAELASALLSPTNRGAARPVGPRGSAAPASPGAPRTTPTMPLPSAASMPDVDDAVTQAMAAKVSSRPGPPGVQLAVAAGPVAVRERGMPSSASVATGRNASRSKVGRVLAAVAALAVAGGAVVGVLASRPPVEVDAPVRKPQAAPEFEGLPAGFWAEGAPRAEAPGAVSVPREATADGVGAGDSGSAAVVHRTVPDEAATGVEPRGDPAVVGDAASGAGPGRRVAGVGARARRSAGAIGRTASSRGHTVRATGGATGRLTISTTPWSEVYLGSRSLGTTPLANVPLPVGSHTVVLRAPGRVERRIRVTIERDRETRVREVL
jgi:serine/threonine-protein kinase